jgi:hypothetical protein
MIVKQKSTTQQCVFITLGFQMPNIWGELNNKIVAQEGSPFSRVGIKASSSLS